MVGVDKTKSRESCLCLFIVHNCGGEIFPVYKNLSFTNRDRTVIVDEIQPVLLYRAYQVLVLDRVAESESVRLHKVFMEAIEDID